jgi:DNA-binding LacI/PurR family transcriptional regulator
VSVTIRDVAEAAGVSIATASRVINNDLSHRVTPATANKVLNAIVALNYIPNENARNLRCLKKSDMPPLNIGVLLTSAVDSYNDNFFYDILLGIQSEAALCGLSVSFTYSLNTIAQKSLENYLRLNKIDGIILLGRMNADILYIVQRSVKHIVYAGINPVNQAFDEVFCDGLACAKSAVKHLASCGYKKIGFVGTAASSGSSTLINEYRYDGYLSCMEDLHLPILRDYIIDTPLNLDMAYKNTSVRLDKGPVAEAYFCANDMCAIGVMKALRDHKLKVPQDVAVIGIDDIDTATYVRPALTTIQIPRHELGSYSIKVLCDQIVGKRKYPIRVELPYKLIVRASCKSPLNR